MERNHVTVCSAPYKYSYLFTYLLTPVHKWLLTLHASSDEQLCNGVASVRLSVCLSVPSINSSSNVQLGRGRQISTNYCHVSFISHSLFHSRLKSFLFCKSSLLQPFLFLIQVSLYGFPRLCLLLLLSISVFLLFSFSVFTLFSCRFRAVD